MKHRYSASYECGRQLVAAGCPLDYLELLPREVIPQQKRFYVREMGGYAESRVYDNGWGQLDFLLPIVIGTNAPSGIVVADWNLLPPWDCHINWDYDEYDIVPGADYLRYEALFGSRLRAVLDEQRLVSRGRPVQGLVCGRSFEPLPDRWSRATTIDAKFRVTDTQGYTATLPIALAIDRSLVFQKELLARQQRPQKRPVGRLFDKPDPVPQAQPKLPAATESVRPLDPEKIRKDLDSVMQLAKLPAELRGAGLQLFRERLVQR